MQCTAAYIFEIEDSVSSENTFHSVIPRTTAHDGNRPPTMPHSMLFMRSASGSSIAVCM